MNCLFCCTRICPNVFVITFASILGFSTFFGVFPQIIKFSTYPSFFFFVGLFAFLCFGMFIWCWLSAAMMDPGRIKDDLERRGILNRIQRGDIPECLRDLPICKICNLPKPKGSEHCDECNACCLRYDHHCGVIGQCVGDKNIKAFVLSFIYACLFGIISAICGLYYCISDSDENTIFKILILIASVYNGSIAIALGCFGIGFIYNMAKDLKNSEFKTRKLMLLFGNNLYERITPIQKTTTFAAWPGVCWNLDFEP